MAEFLANQTDFIVFFNGLSWVLCGMMALSLARTARLRSWTVFGAFALLRGTSTWLDLIALTTGDTPGFATFRAATLALSFILLLEFARQEGRAYGVPVPGAWIHGLVLALVTAGWVLGGANLAVVLTRYCVALPAAIGTGLALLRRTRELEGRQHWITISCFAASLLYAFACGLVVPATALPPGNLLNETAFLALTGIPIELVRGGAASLLAIGIAGIWFSRTGLESGSDVYRQFLRRLFSKILIAMTLALVCGWGLTQYMGKIYRSDTEAEAHGDMTVLTSRFAGESDEISSIAALLSADHDVLALLQNSADPTVAREAKHEIEIASEAASSRHGMILDLHGQTLASNFVILGEDDARNFMDSPASQRALEHGSALMLHYDFVSNLVEFYAAGALRDENGTAHGFVVLQRTLTAFAADLSDFRQPYFLIDSDGVIVVTNRRELAFRPLWPLAPGRFEMLREVYPQLDNRPVLQHEIGDSTWSTFQENRAFFRRETVSAPGWSLVMALPPSGRYASRALGIVITLLVALIALAYLLGRERRIYDAISLEQRLHLQMLAKDLETKANSDALTGIANRLPFERALAAEIDRAQRYGTPLSVALFDADHFKRVNDTHGHPTGDAVLRRLASIATARIRNTDTVARWGGEEFVLLMPQCDVHAARQAAEKLRGTIAEATFETVGHVTCSFGVAQWQSGNTAEELVARADAALYSAKANGRNRVECSEPQVAAA